LGCFARRRYSACPVDSCRSVCLVGEPTMMSALTARSTSAIGGKAVVQRISLQRPGLTHSGSRAAGFSVTHNFFQRCARVWSSA
jgi:hypothetical protein